MIMHLSEEGLRLIKSFEGYHKRLQNGDCAAYLCPANVPTIGYGCTEGIKLGMVWTEEQAEQAFRRELAKFEAGVGRLVTAVINQNQFDALVSFAYNVGLGGLEKSSVLKHVNAEQFDKVPAALALWNKGGGRILPGLVSRRQREGALFMKPAEPPEEPFMPHKVTKSLSWWQLLMLRLGLGGGVATGGAVATDNVPFTSSSTPVPAPSLPPPPDLAPALAWKGFGESLASLWGFAWQNLLLTALLLAIIAGLYFLPKVRS